MSDWPFEVCGITVVAPADPADGLSRLSLLVEGAEAAQNRQAAIRLVAEALGDGMVMRGFVAAQRADPAAVSGLLMRLGGVAGLKLRAEKLERAIRDEARNQEAIEMQARIESAQERRPNFIAASLAECLSGHPLPAGLVCPDGWEITASGIFRRRIHRDSGDTRSVEVSHRPIVVEGRLRDVQDNTVSLALGWPTAAGRWHVHPAPRLQVADARQLVMLAAHDAPVTSNNAAELVAFLGDFEAANARHIPELRVSSRMGWHGRGADRCFLWGRSQVRPGEILTASPIEDEAPARWAGGQVHLLVTDVGLRGLVEGFRAEGSWAGWIACVNHAAPYPAVFLGLYAALVPPLLDLLPHSSNFILDLCGETSLGKTTALRLAASAWGCPDERGSGLLFSWDASRVFIERAAALGDFLPLFLDDTKRARRREDVGHTLYDYSSGIGRGRGTPQGVQRPTRAHGVLLSTGEAPATSFTEDGGTRARTLCVWGSPFGGASRETAAAVTAISAGINLHFGHAGPRLLQWLIDAPEATAFVVDEHEAQLTRWTGLANGNPVASRLAQHVAAMAVAQRILHEKLGVPEPEADPLPLLWQAVLQSTVESDRPADALRAVLSWATSQQRRFWGQLKGAPGDDDAPHAGWLGAWSRQAAWPSLAILPTELKSFLAREKYDAEAVLRAWEDRGWLKRDAEHRTAKVTVGRRKERCIVITRAAIDSVG